MTIQRTILFLVVCCLVAPIGAIADDLDIIGIAAVEPNVMIVLDSSGSMSDEIDGVEKIAIAKQVVTDLIQNTPNVRFGVLKFAYHSAEMVAEIGTSTAALVTAVNGMTQTSVGTPLGDALWEAGQYFAGTFAGYSSPIDLECRPNMVIVVSDGLENSSTQHLPDVAADLVTTDHAGGLPGDQFVYVHTVGFGIDPGDEAAANAILEEAATNGGGSFYSTDSASSLAASLAAAVETIVTGSFTFAGALVPSTSVTGDDYAYQAAFLTDPVKPFWNGKLSAFQRDADGTIPTDADGVPLSSALVWEAGQELRTTTAASRTIYTEIAGTRQSFVRTNGAITPALLGVATAAERSKLIDFIRGVDTFDHDGDSNITEQRDWKLGAIVHSAPVLVTPPFLVSSDPDYLAFKVAQAGRPAVLLVGANDGMLHAFSRTDGSEMWGFIPSDQLDSLRDLAPLTGDHPYSVDSSPVVADVKTGGAYKTVVIFGERRGGGGYHALDITDTTNPLYLWSFNDAKIAESWSVPVIGRVRIQGGGEKYVALFGGGYDTASNNASGDAFFAVDIETGAKLWEYSNDGTTNDKQYMNYSLAASPTALDLDSDGYIDRVYIGDVGGQLWKFDMSPEATLSGGLVNNWTGKRLFVATPLQANPPPAGNWQPAQAIYGAPAAAFGDNGALWVYFGTGDLNHPANTSQNRFYGIKDTTAMTNGSFLTEASLFDVTSTDGTGANGWYFTLLPDEKVLYSANVFDENVYFTSFTPATAAACNGGSGPATLYSVKMETGYGAIDWATGDELASSDSSTARSTIVGSGIPGDPLLVTTVTDGVLDVAVVTGTSEEQIDDQSAPAVALRQILYWHERY